MPFVDQCAGALLVPLALWILLSGIDDALVCLAAAWAWAAHRLLGRAGLERPSMPELRALPEKRIAIFVPLWREEAVIARMVEHNVAHIDYGNYEIFLGAYPNDAPTLEEVRRLERRFPHVHAAVCPRPGPTSKADCLNTLYQRMLERERSTGLRYHSVLTHDAEDVIHPLSLLYVNYYADTVDMIQVPVLPLATPFRELTHGVYCDEFAESQTKDMPARHVLGGFLPSNGVGTAYSRYALERLAETGGVFAVECLTEDYENGLRLHLLGCAQLFTGIGFHGGAPVATREYFPRTFRGAVKQRTRWITGISLQTWERHGWSGGWRQLYWLWRDRKGLVGNPAGLLTTAIFLYGAATYTASGLSGAEWGMREAAGHPWLLGLLGVNLFFQLLQLTVRAGAAARIYGGRFAAGVPLRALYGNVINCAATICALWQYGRARAMRRPLRWLKTDHDYPEAAGAPAARALPAPGGELEVCRALSRRTGLPLAGEREAPTDRLTRGFPRSVTERWNVLPWRVEAGSLVVAVTRAPSAALVEALRPHTRLPVRFVLLPPSRFEAMRRYGPDASAQTGGSGAAGR